MSNKFIIDKLNILVVDSDEPMRSMLISTIRTLGAQECREAGGSEEFFDVVKGFIPDIIICEWKIDGDSGIDLTRKIRTDESSPYRMAGIIIMTAFVEERHVVQARDVGATEFLTKPISADSLFARICSIINNPRLFIESDGFAGPDRRRRHDPFQVGMARRETDNVGEEVVEEEVQGDASDDFIEAMLGL